MRAGSRRRGTEQDGSAETVDRPISQYLLWGDRTEYARALECLELPLLDPLEPRVTECTDEGVLCESLLERLGLEGADAAPQPVWPPGARGPRVPSDEEGARAV